jgi:hypothetical protein
MPKHSHYPAGYSAGGDHTKREARQSFRSRAQYYEDRIPGFDGVKQGLSCRERMTDAGGEMQFNYGVYIP